MNSVVRLGVVLMLLILAAGPAAAKNSAPRYGQGKSGQFAMLPEGVSYPEGIAVNPNNGDIFVSTFNFSGNNKVLRYNRKGRLLAQVDLAATPLLGLAFNPVDSKVYICNTGDLVGDTSRIQRIAAGFTSADTVEDVVAIPHIQAPVDRTVANPDGSEDSISFGNNAAAPNAMVFDEAGDLYVSDSFQGAVFKIEAVASLKSPAEVITVVHDSLLATAGFPPFGANGLALSSDEKTLFIANTGDDRVLAYDLETDDLSVFAESINGADGLAWDERGHLLVAGNQEDKIVMLNDTGRVVAKFGAPPLVHRNGSHSGLLFPASMAVLGCDVYVTNLALPLTGAEGDEPEEEVTTFSVSKFKLRGSCPHHRR